MDSNINNCRQQKKIANQIKNAKNKSNNGKVSIHIVRSFGKIIGGFHLAYPW